MISSDINEPIIESSNAIRVQTYIALSVTALVFSAGIYAFLQEGSLWILGFSMFLFAINMRDLFRDDVHVTRKAIYRQIGYKKYQILAFSDLTYAFFEDADAAYLGFGTEVLTDFIITDQHHNFAKLKALLRQTSQIHLKHHGYIIADRESLSRTDNLGCLDCKKQFAYSDIKQWSVETTGWLFKKTKTEQPICPSCRKENSLVVSKAGKLTGEGLQSMNALRDYAKPS